MVSWKQLLQRKIGKYPIHRYIREVEYRYYYYTKLQFLERLHGRKSFINYPSNIYLFSFPRGGSTWLTEVIQGLPNSLIIWEPLFKGRRPYRDLKKLNFEWLQPIPQEADWPEAKIFFSKLLNREILHPSIIYNHKLSQVKHAETYIFKFCWGNLMLPWLIDNFEIKPIFFIRHPAAIVASQSRYARFLKKHNQPYHVNPNMRYKSFFDSYQSFFPEINTPVRRLAANWAFQAKYLIEHPYNNTKWLTVTYESLLLNPVEELQRIFKWLNRPLSASILEKVQSPSTMTNKEDMTIVKNASLQLDKWKKTLTKEQVEAVFDVVEGMFDIRYYDKFSSTPDLKKLYNESN